MYSRNPPIKEGLRVLCSILFGFSTTTRKNLVCLITRNISPTCSVSTGLKCSDDTNVFYVMSIVY